MAIFSGWTPFPFEMRDASLNPMGTNRPEGLHLGTIVREMKKAAGENVSEIPGEQPGLRAQVGFVWETAVEYMLGGMSVDEAMETAFKRYAWELRKGISSQVRIRKDGIHMTPDAVNELVGEIESWKATWKKLPWTQDDFESKFWPWMVAEKGYCYALAVDTCRFIVLWQAGDYSKGRGTGPMAMQATMTWTADELVENWRTVLKYRDMIEKEAAA